jgi:hypothetical protein
VLSNLRLRDFRCFEEIALALGPGVNLFMGPNGEGKTAILEGGLCVLLRLHSQRSATLAPVVKIGRKHFVTAACLTATRLSFATAQLRRRLLFDGIEQRVFADYLALARVVSFANADIELVQGSSEPRRRYVDFLGMQIDATYRPTPVRLRTRVACAQCASQIAHTAPTRARCLRRAADRARSTAATIASEDRGSAGAEAADADARISGEEEKFEMHFRRGAGDDLGAELEQCAQKRIDCGKLWSAHIAIISNYASTRC